MRVSSFYRFLALGVGKVHELRGGLEAAMGRDGLLGLVIVAPEGVNGTVAGPADAVKHFQGWLEGALGGEQLRFKDSDCDEPPFVRASVVVRDEIVGMKRPGLVPAGPDHRHIDAEEWHRRLSEPGAKLVIDTRNDYEVRIGRFQGALDPGLERFSDWPAYLDKTDLPRDTPVMLYCTGGIRCEKAILEMEARGFRDLVQLRDGILGYLERYPDGHFEGECYVFDRRVAVDQRLNPSRRYGTCPACGHPSDRWAECSVCDERYVACPSCDWPQVCSKPCRDLWQRHGQESRKRIGR